MRVLNNLQTAVACPLASQERVYRNSRFEFVPRFASSNGHSNVAFYGPGHVRRPCGRSQFSTSCQAIGTDSMPLSTKASGSDNPPLKAVIVGAGIGGLVLAVGLLKTGFEVTILERDLTAIRGEGKYRGPIQIQSNALAALEALDKDVAEQVLEQGCITGDRINGLCDGVTGEWYCKFDTFHPAADRGLPVTRVISRHTLQKILADKVRELGGPEVLVNDVHVIDYENIVDSATGEKCARVITEDNQIYTGDIVIGADGIWSKIRRKLIGSAPPQYSEYTCYTGISDFTPPDIDIVGYRVFLGNQQYFVSSDVGGGKMQWYAFHREPAGGSDEPGKRKERLMEIFGHWSDMVTDLILATPEEDVLRRDIYDRAPVFKWVEGRVALLGDSAHAMQPNLGQGGCMAIEDAFQLATDLAEEAKASADTDRRPDVDRILKDYFNKRLLRASAIHGMARMAAMMASTYKAYLGEGLGPLEAMTSLKIPHPGRVSGQIVLKLTMPLVLDWVLGGYQGSLKSAGRTAYCKLGDEPQGFSESDFPSFMRDDDALLRASLADWMLQPLSAVKKARENLTVDTSTGVVVDNDGILVGRSVDADVIIDLPSTSSTHAKLKKVGPDYFVTDLDSEFGTWLNGRRIPSQTPERLKPGDELCFGERDPGDKNIFKVKMRHNSLSANAHGQYKRRQRVIVPSSPEKPVLTA